MAVQQGDLLNLSISPDRYVEFNGTLNSGLQRQRGIDGIRLVKETGLSYPGTDPHSA